MAITHHNDQPLLAWMIVLRAAKPKGHEAIGSQKGDFV